MNLDKRTVPVAVALDAIAMVEHCCNHGVNAPSTGLTAWWDGCNDEGAVERRDLLVTLAKRLHEYVDHSTLEVLRAKYGDAWDWDVLPVLLETVFSWNEDGGLDLDWDAPIHHIDDVMREHKE